MGNDMSAAEILAQAGSAADDLFKYARFVKNTEGLRNDTTIFATDKQRSEYQACWFELEVVNALALDGWESNGKPTVWESSWSERYRNDAKNLVEQLCKLILRSAQQ